MNTSKTTKTISKRRLSTNKLDHFRLREEYFNQLKYLESLNKLFATSDKEQSCKTCQIIIENEQKLNKT